MKHFILATAGHVDHGKSALVKALTGTDPDRLPEEKARGITIELGFAQLKFPDINVGIVDVPGHEDFVKNMVAGVGAIDLALLVVAADDGWMPQTEEHLQILTYLGVTRAVIALTKIDLSESEDGAENNVRAQLTGTPFNDAPIVRTSVPTLRGIEELRAQLAHEFESLTPQPDIGKPRLAVDRAFTLRGIGTVVTGTLAGGTFRRADAVVVQPANIPARIRAIQNHGREEEQLGPGARTALNLSDAPIARGKGERGISRGDVVTLAALGEASAVIDVVLARSTRLSAKTRPLKRGTAVRVHHGSGNIPAHVIFSASEELRAGETGIAQLRFDTPVFMLAGDRFIVRDSSEQSTLAGGIVLDPDSTLEKFRNAAQEELLKERALSPESTFVFARSQLARDRFVSRAKLLLKSCFSRAEISATISALNKSGTVIEHGEMIVDAKWWADLRVRAIAAINEEHTVHPNRSGLELARLRNILEIPSPALFDILVEDLCSDGFVHQGETIHRRSHQPALPASLQAAALKIRETLAARPFDPPSRKEMASDLSSQEALRFFIRTGELVEAGDDIVISAPAFTQMRDHVAAFIREHGSASVGQLREALGSSRRVMVPFLEQLDRNGVTQRVGDRRVLHDRI